jgi:hypothetical protein
VGSEKQPSRPVDEIQGVFELALPVIHSALVSYYRLSEDEARGAEEDLLMWFQRLGRRGGSGHMPAKMLRLSLLSAACQYGRSFQLWKLGGVESADAALNELLAREPEEVATDLDLRVEKETR